MHYVVKHKSFSGIYACMGRTSCDVCGLQYGTISALVNHIGNSKLCKLNLLLRGPYLDKTETELVLQTVRDERSDARRLMYPVNSSKQVPYRQFGPFLPVMGLDSVYIRTTNGHPLGGKRWKRLPRYPPAAHEDSSCACSASLFKQCDYRCILCRHSSLS